MNFYNKLIQPVETLGNDLCRAYSASKNTPLGKSDLYFIYKLIMMVFQMILFVLGSNLRYFSSSIAFCLIIPLQAHTLKNLIFYSESQDDNPRPFNFLGHSVFDFLSLIESNYLKISLILLIFFALYTLILKKSSSIVIKVAIILLFYFKTIYSYSEADTLPISTFLCCVFYFSIGCAMFISRKYKFLISSIFYSVFSSLNILLLMNDRFLNENTIKEWLSWKFIGESGVLKVLIVVSIFIQNILPVFVKTSVSFQSKKI